MTGAEAAARRTAATAVLADFRRELDTAPSSSPPGREWMLRLAEALSSLLEAPAVATGLLADGSAIVAPADLPSVLAALSDAIARKGPAIGRCPACRPGRPCPVHQGDAAHVAAWKAIATRLGGR